MEQATVNVKDILTFIAYNSRPLETNEFKDFLMALTSEERATYGQEAHKLLREIK